MNSFQARGLPDARAGALAIELPLLAIELVGTRFRIPSSGLAFLRLHKYDPMSAPYASSKVVRDEPTQYCTTWHLVQRINFMLPSGPTHRRICLQKSQPGCVCRGIAASWKLCRPDKNRPRGFVGWQSEPRNRRDSVVRMGMAWCQLVFRSVMRECRPRFDRVRTCPEDETDKTCSPSVFL